LAADGPRVQQSDETLPGVVLLRSSGTADGDFRLTYARVRSATADVRDNIEAIPRKSPLFGSFSRTAISIAESNFEQKT
jgi:hypothetical protein